MFSSEVRVCQKGKKYCNWPPTRVLTLFTEVCEGKSPSPIVWRGAARLRKSVLDSEYAVD